MPLSKQKRISATPSSRYNILFLRIPVLENIEPILRCGHIHRSASAKEKYLKEASNFNILLNNFLDLSNEVLLDFVENDNNIINNNNNKSNYNDNKKYNQLISYKNWQNVRLELWCLIYLTARNLPS